MRKQNILFVCLLLAGCISTPNLWGTTPVPMLDAALPAAINTATLVPTQTNTVTPTTEPLIAAPTSTPVLTAALEPTDTPLPEGIKRVLIISYDGMRTDAIAEAPMNNLIGLMENGAYNLTSARTIAYPSTSPSHASMLSGLCMEQHGMIYDRYFIYMGYSKGVDIFDLAQAAGMKTVMLVSKAKLRQLAEPETTDVYEVRYGESAVGKEAVVQIEQGFDLMFIHFAGADLRGHKYGWMSGEYLKVLRQGDEALGKILTALNENGLRDSTLIIITADHGGHDKNHVGLVIEDYRIPWIASGPGVASIEITTPMQTMDTAATAAYALGLPLQTDWAGIPVYEAFGETRLKFHPDEPCE